MTDNIHWSLSSANGSEVADESLLWRGKVEGDGVDLDTNVISLQGAGHVTLGRFHDNCPGNPSMCEDGFTVSFWMKYGVKFASCILGQNELYHEAIESMMSAVTPSRSKWIRCYHAKSDGCNAQAFHSRCDNKGPTVTLVRVREIVFGGFLDQNWGGPNGIRSISSDSAFLFNINNALELKPFKLNIKKSQKQIAALYDPTTGPVFGQDDLRVTFDNRSIPLYGASHIGHAYELPQGFNGTDQVDGMKLFAGTRIFSWDDLEVFYYDVPHASLGVSDPATVQNSAFNSSSEKVSLDYSAQSAPVGSASEWCAYYNDEHQWLEASIGYDPDHTNFELKALKSGGKSGMTWYLLNSSTDGKIWNEFKNGERIPEGKGVSFIGNLRYVRFIPESWDSRICMKVEVDAGKNKSQVAFNKLTASSELCMSPAYFARLHLTGECFSAWCPRPRSQDPHPWLSVNLNSLNQILFVATQGSDNGQDKTHVLSYYLSYVHEEDGTIRNYTENGNLKIFEGNWDGSTVVKNAILNPFQTKSLTFHIVDSKSDQCCLRVEIYGPRCQQPLGMENGAISDAQITASSWHTPSDPKAYVPSRARLHTQHNEDPYLAGGWVAAPDDVYPWLQVHLGNETFKVTRVATQGRNFYKQWVKKYKLQYSQDGVSFNYYKAYGETKHKSFWAKAESDIVAYRDLDPPIRARFIRFRPTLWHYFATMRVELYGCPLDCSPKPLGMENGAISDSHITASSENGLKWPAKNARLNYPQGGAWAPKLNPDEWLQIDFLNYRTSVTSVATQGRSIGNITQWVSTYRLQYSNLEYYFKYFKEDGTNEAKVFSGNIDGNSTVSHDLNPPIIARYVRFLPLTYHGLIAMRVELYYGCVQASEAEDDTIVSWRGTNSNSEDKAFELKQVNDLLTPHHQLSVTAANETYTLYIPTVPRTWHHVTFTWSKAWGIKFYQDGALVAGTGRSEKSVFVTKGESSGLFIIGNRVLTSGRSGKSNFQIQGLTVWPRLVSLAQLKHELETGLTVWPRLVSLAQLKHELETVTCHVMDQCLKQSYNDDFDWSFGISCTETYHTGPCGEHVLSGEVRRSFSNAAFNRKTEQYDRTSFSRMVVDGDFNSRSELGQVEETWWMVDLGREGLVTGVRLVFKLASNGNNTASRLDIIIVHETGKIEQSLCEAVNKSDIIANEVAYKVTSCGKPLLGRFVKVEVTMEVHVKCKKLTTCPPSPVMNLYEVEVLMGKEIGSFREVFFNL
ncbi:uncharacterized protein LOC111338360 [Stylophora pistillata]|uniref:uncharacterized protein LOC111338360 n=1 Tax=Stylophora pistillata TaxID=50429 RepID=UPI000C051D73|nr:uncharacterized protein LOC111338360 [Stylophora pistillata]